MTEERARANYTAVPSGKPVSVATMKRIRAVAAEEGLPEPEVVLGDDGAPSAEIMTFCGRTHVTLDYIFLGERPKYRSEPARDGGALDRVHRFCRWFELEPPKLRSRGGGVVLTDELLAWISREGVDLDWLVSGSLQRMADAFRSTAKLNREVIDAIRDYDETEKGMLLVALRAMSEDGMKADDALGAWRTAVMEKRAAEQDKRNRELLLMRADVYAPNCTADSIHLTEGGDLK